MDQRLSKIEDANNLPEGQVGFNEQDDHVDTLTSTESSMAAIVGDADRARAGTMVGRGKHHGKHPICPNKLTYYSPEARLELGKRICPTGHCEQAPPGDINQWLEKCPKIPPVIHEFQRTIAHKGTTGMTRAGLDISEMAPLEAAAFLKPRCSGGGKCGDDCGIGCECKPQLESDSAEDDASVPVSPAELANTVAGLSLDEVDDEFCDCHCCDDHHGCEEDSGPEGTDYQSCDDSKSNESDETGHLNRARQAGGVWDAETQKAKQNSEKVQPIVKKCGLNNWCAQCCGPMPSPKDLEQIYYNRRMRLLQKTEDQDQQFLKDQ